MVKLTLLGSIVSNLLLVMGSAFIAGGVLHPMQHYNQRGINVNCGLLLLTGGRVGGRAAGVGAIDVPQPPARSQVLFGSGCGRAGVV